MKQMSDVHPICDRFTKITPKTKWCIMIWELLTTTVLTPKVFFVKQHQKVIINSDSDTKFQDHMYKWYNILWLAELLERCEANEFQCATDHSCIRVDSVCDGHSDCPDASDELNCGMILAWSVHNHFLWILHDPFSYYMYINVSN